MLASETYKEDKSTCSFNESLGKTKHGNDASFKIELVLLDLTGCSSLREFPCLPTSLESLEISRCLNPEVPGRVQCLDLVPSFSHLNNLNVSYCNLGDSCLSNDWSNLVSLKTFTIDGNNITSLPKCIQTLPGVETLRISKCSELESILGLPKSLKLLITCDNESLEKVQPAPNSRFVVIKRDCPNLCDIEGHHMVQSADKVDRKILRYLGLESNAGARMKLALKVFHEFGIFTTFVPEKQIPSRFMYREGGSRISFVVPSLHDGLRLRGFSLCAMLSPPATNLYAVVEMKVYNLTKDLLWTYEYGFLDFIQKVKKRAWLSFWRCGNLLEVGDKFHARIKIDTGILVKECCINLIYEDDEEVDGERSEAHHDQMSWTDKMHKDISDYVHIGGRFVSNFRNDVGFAPEIAWIYENLADNGGIELSAMKIWKEMMRGGREAVYGGVLREEKAEEIVPQENGSPLVPSGYR
ncbi:hypothetical protein L1887_04627 [Cichorium endivia]|nr:hypothetical protein L1887_04627 [Cichorium endivia]